MCLPARIRAASLHAFTYVELMIVLGIMMTLLTLAAMAIGPALNRSNVTQQAHILLADVFSQQQKAMQGELMGGSAVLSKGIHFETDRYILFSGEQYVSTASANIVVNLPSELRFYTINLPDNAVIFEEGSGAVRGHDPARSSVTLAPAAGGTARTLQINRYGVVELY